MRAVRRISFIACILACQIISQARDVSACIPVQTVCGVDAAYSAGERLQFIIHYKFGLIDSDLGNAEITLDTMRISGEKCFHTHVYGRTRRFYDTFFKVREDFHSYFAYDGLKPVRFTRNTLEGRYRASDSYVYVRDGADSSYIDALVYTSSWKESRNFRLPLDECTFDLPSLFYYARNINMDRIKPDTMYPMTFAIDDEVFNVHFVYRGKEIKNVNGLGRVRCMKFEAELLKGGVFKGDSDLVVYISDDRNRLPVLFGAPILVGSVEGRMVGYSGLKHPFSSLITT